MKTIYSHLKEYSESDYCGFHMPGHKRNRERFGDSLPYEIDITEIDGFDDLHHAEGMIKQAEERAARLYGAEETHFLVNGSTVGILSAILGTTTKGDKVLVARNCHKSVYNALFLQELESVYVYPEYDENTGLNGVILPSEIERILEKDSAIRAVVIVSPTYDGVLSDVEAIAKVVHERGIPLIVDEAHGAHFGFHPYFSQNANKKGADLVIHSVHKTLPSLTQTALLHINGVLVDRKRVRMYLRMLQSSSPSYVLMASIDACMELLEKRSEEIFGDYVDNLHNLRDELGKLKRLKLVSTENYDNSKLIISTKNTNFTGKELKQILLDNYHLQMEMAAGSYVLAMTSVGDEKEHFERLLSALQKVDNELSGTELCATAAKSSAKLPHAEYIAKSSEALLDFESESVLWEKSIGKTAMEYAYLYPPGIPVIVPGEKISAEMISYLKKHAGIGFQIEGLEQEKYIRVRKEHE